MVHAVRRIVVAPFFLLGVILGVLLVILAVASISVSAWLETVYDRLGFPPQSQWLAGVLGVVIYLSFGIVGLLVVGLRWLGWPGAFLGPLLGVIAIAVLDRW